MPVEIAPRTGAEIVGQVSLRRDTIDNSSEQPVEVIASDAKEFSLQPEVDNIMNRPCPGAPCNPGPGGPPPKCAPLPRPCNGVDEMKGSV